MGKAKAASATLVIPDSCARCRFWRRIDAARGLCRRFPPVPLASAGQAQPVTHEAMWCGEFGQAAEEAAQPAGFVHPAEELAA